MAAKKNWRGINRWKDTIIYIPYYVKSEKNNEYTLNMINILKEKYTVTGILSSPSDIVQLLKTRAVFLNWIETDLDIKMKSQLFCYKLAGAKIIWVFHNKYPHDTDCEGRITDNMHWLARHSSVILLHSKSSKKYIPDAVHNGHKAVYIPHVLYKQYSGTKNTDVFRESNGIGEHDFVFTVFGMIRPYKNIESAIEAFKNLNLKNAWLYVAGNPSSKDYAQKILNLCREERNIILDLHYLSNVQMDRVLENSDVIVLPYKDKSSMNSGVMIQSFSKGKTVIAPDICMAKDLVAGGFFYMYHDCLEKAMLKAYENGKFINKKMGEQAQKYVIKYNSQKMVKNKINKILE